MKKIMRIIVVILIVLQLLVTKSSASTFSKDSIGTSGGTFLKLGKGVRAIGMGEAYAGVSDNLDAIYWNPAGLNNINNIEVSAMHSIWFENIFYDYISAAFPGNKGVFGFSINYLGMDKIDKYLNTGKSANDSYSPYDLLAYLSYANKIKKQLFGINIKFMQSVIDDDSAAAVGLDLGYMKYMNEKLTFGGVIQNMGTELKFRDKGDPQPFNIRMGFSYKGLLKRMVLAVDLNLPIDNIPSGHIGAEYGYNIGKFDFRVRTGFKTTTITDIEPLAGLSAGLGIKSLGMTFDYAWVPYGNLGNTHHIALSYVFATKKTDEELKKELTPKEKLELKKKYFTKALRLFMAKKYRKSILEFENILKLDPGHFESIKYIERAEKSLKK